MNFFEPLGSIKQWFTKAPKSKAHVDTLVDIFASFISIDNVVDNTEAEVALDLLRHAFPEADHGWLARRLQRALRSTVKAEEHAQTISDEMDDSALTSLCLQIYLLVDSSNQKSVGMEAFRNLMSHVNREDLLESITAEMSDSYQELLPFTRVVFSSQSLADVLLPPQADGYGFRVYRNDSIIILRNTGDKTIWIGGKAVIKGQLLRLRSHQRVILPGWTLSADDLSFFLTAKQQKEKRTLYIHETNKGLTADRSRSRQSELRIDFSTQAEITVLRSTDLSLNSAPLDKTIANLAGLHEKIRLSDGKQVALESLRRQAMDAGGRFKLDDGEQTVVASNDPSAIKKGDLLLSPGLSGKVLLKIKFDPGTSNGELEIIESDRSIFVNNQPVKQKVALNDGMLIRLSASQGIRCRFSEGIIDEERTVIRELKLDSISHEFVDDKSALDNIDLTIKRGEMLCIIGPSGCGKSTLLSTMAGQLKPTRGHVRLNGIALYYHRERLAPFITYMPQEEALNANLTVREHLENACSIRRPHLSKTEQAKRVDSILGELTLQALEHRKVGSPGDKSISGGERSRLNLGLDLGSAAEILLFDEPISGLSSKDSEHVAETLKSVAKDKIVICSLHRPGNSVLSLFDKVLLLDKGGRVAFYGTSKEMFTYFRNACAELGIPSRKRTELDDAADFVFDVIETPLQNLTHTLAAGYARRFPPRFWQERFESHTLLAKVASGEVPAQTQLGDMPRADDNMPIPSSRIRSYNDYYTLFKTHLRRSCLSKLRNKGTIYSSILEAPMLAFLIGLTLRASPEGSYEFGSGNNLIEYLFLSVTVGMFLGLTNSATEILRDKPVLRRERNQRYGAGIYLLAKFTTLAILAIIQSGIYISIGNFMLEIENMFFYHWAWMSLTAIVGTAMALLISSVVKSERAALSAVPLLLVPQLLLAGALVQFEDMNRGLFQGGQEARQEGAEPFPSKLMPLRYAYEGIVITQANKNWFTRKTLLLSAYRDRLKEKTDPDTGKTNLTDEEKQRLEILKQAIQYTQVAEAQDRDGAKLLILKLTQAGLYGTMEELQSIKVRDDDIEHPSCQSYYLNTKVADATKLSNSTRAANAYKRETNKEEANTNSVFLDEWKFWFNMQISTVKWCLGVLVFITSTCLILSILIITKWNRKVN